ncbi:uncharacterized protein LOC115747948 isoform X2 [Rhodamnia argentea]|uniref:Uncharacterized protein LOC115747948 isoform X2 n=1 Tax=Rhodamnia argentea TaxID=178133 RepID=A0ABM3H7M1_9MYRT|nr:uncharacterized protein LOC115747948 isoform X2 [Rhodamnia argentea]
MHGDGSTAAVGLADKPSEDETDVEKQGEVVVLVRESGGAAAMDSLSTGMNQTTPVTIVVSGGDSYVAPEPAAKDSKALECVVEELPSVGFPKKGYLSRSGSSHEQCRVCQEEKEEDLIDLGCQCRGGIAKAHRSCIEAWFHTRGSNKCEICQQAAANVPPPESHSTPSFWIWRIDPSYGGSGVPEQHGRACFSPLWVAFSILVGGLFLDVLISVTLGVSALPVNIIIGVIVVLGLGTALRLALEFCHEWGMRRAVQRVEANENIRYHPSL